MTESFLSAGINYTCITLKFFSRLFSLVLWWLFLCVPSIDVTHWILNETNLLMCLCVYSLGLARALGITMQFFYKHTRSKSTFCMCNSFALTLIVIVEQLIWVQMNRILTPHSLNIFTIGTFLWFWLYTLGYYCKYSSFSFSATYNFLLHFSFVRCVCRMVFLLLFAVCLCTVEINTFTKTRSIWLFTEVITKYRTVR